MTQQAADPVQQARAYMRHQGSKSLPDLEALIARTGEDWNRCLKGMSDAQAEFTPATPTGPAGEDEWCAKEVLGHILASNEGVNQQIVEMAGVASQFETHDKVRDMGVRSEADEALPIKSLRQRIAAVCEETQMLARALGDSNNLDQVFSHPAFGPLNLKEWLAFHRIHGMDHIQQIDKIKADPAYPKA